jgi:hypothetical protein
MGSLRQLPVPDDQLLSDIDAAIALVASGHATRVRVVGMPGVDRLIGLAVAHGQASGVPVHVDRSGASPGLTIGPRR